MAILKLASTKITPELLERLNKFTESTGSTSSAVIRQAIELFLDNAESTKSTELTDIEGNLKPSQLVARVDAVDVRLTAFEARLTAIESRSVSTAPAAPPKFTTPKSNTTPKSKKAPAPAPAPTSPPIAGAMTIGELFAALKELGYPHSQVTLSKRLNESRATQQLPDDLTRLGVVADWETRASTSNFNNQCRWLRLE